jgi:hypothetical protein
MRSHVLAARLVPLLAFGAAPLVLAQGTITSGAVSLVRGASGFDESPAASFYGVSTPGTDDHLFETGWWYRIEGDASETVMPVPEEADQSYVGPTSVIDWPGIASKLDFSESTWVYDHSVAYGHPAGAFESTLLVENVTLDETLTIHVYHLLDLDLLPNNLDDSATLAEWSPRRVLRIRDPGANVAYYSADETPTVTSHYLVRPLGGTDVAAELSDGGVDTFADTGTPFGPGDLTAGWHFTVTLGPGNSLPVGVLVTINASDVCDEHPQGVFCSDFERDGTKGWTTAPP